MRQDTEDITTLIEQWQAGNSESRERCIERIYPELKKIAGAVLKNERKDHTLAPDRARQ